MSTDQPLISVLGSFVGAVWIHAPRLPVKGETLIGTAIAMGPGGKGSNQAIGARRLGARVAFIASIGRDLFGQMALDLWQREGIDTRYVLQRDDVPTGGALSIIDPNGDNYIVVDPAANERLTPDDVRTFEPEISRSRLVMAQLEIRPETVAEGFRIARRAGVPTLLNPGPFRALDDALLSLVDVLTPNETEARQLAGLPPDDTSPLADVGRRLRDRGVAMVLITRGENGVLAVTRDGIVEMPAFPVEVVDVTGAGDSFNAALAVALARGLSLPEALVEATAAGALAVTRDGVVPALPTRAQLQAFLRERGATSRG